MTAPGRLSLRVAGMGCAGCEASVEGAVKAAFPEAEEVRADHVAGTLTLVSAAPAEDVAAAVTAAGYPAEG